MREVWLEWLRRICFNIKLANSRESTGWQNLHCFYTCAIFQECVCWWLTAARSTAGKTGQAVYHPRQKLSGASVFSMLHWWGGNCRRGLTPPESTTSLRSRLRVFMPCLRRVSVTPLTREDMAESCIRRGFWAARAEMATAAAAGSIGDVKILCYDIVQHSEINVSSVGLWWSCNINTGPKACNILFTEGTVNRWKNHSRTGHVWLTGSIKIKILNFLHLRKKTFKN